MTFRWSHLFIAPSLQDLQLPLLVHLISVGDGMPHYCGISDPNDEVGAVSGHLVNLYKEVQQGPVAHSCGTPVLRTIVTNTQLPNYQSYY